MEVLVIYQFCTFGGVERVILNRANALRKHGQDVHISVCYLKDYGALQSFQQYIQLNSLTDQVSAFLMNDTILSNLDDYDLVLNIDTPQLFEDTQNVKKFFVECHTPYIQNRQYLKDLPPNVCGIVVPSTAFKNILLGEFPNLPPVTVLQNPVSDEFFSISEDINARYPKRPLAYLARLDELKNYPEAFDIFSEFSQDEKVMFAIVGKATSLTQKRVLTLLREKGIIGKTIIRSEIDFNAVPDFIKLIKSHHGIFVSPSLGESFGLSVAEFMSAGVPVILSRIDVHGELVNNDHRFLYNNGDIVSARNKIINILANWDEYSTIISAYAQKFSAPHFYSSWQEFILNHNIGL